MFAFMPRILMAAHIPPGPAVESAFLHMRDVVGNQVVAQTIALIYRAPQLAGLGIDRNSASGIANAIGIHAQRAVRGIAPENVGTIFLARSCVGIVYVRSRAHRDKQFLAILRERYRT